MYTWKVVVHDNVTAVCAQNENKVLHALVIDDRPMAQDVAEIQAQTLIKMRALKDVLNPDWSDFEAAQYAVANKKWLDNKFLDSARKRWGSANYQAERWLLVGAYMLGENVMSLAQDLLVELELKDYIQELTSPTAAQGAMNKTAIIGPKIGNVHGLFVSGKLQLCQGIWLQDHHTQTAGVAVVISENGAWNVLVIDHKQTHLGHLLVFQSPPSAKDLQGVLPHTTPLELSHLVALG